MRLFGCLRLQQTETLFRLHKLAPTTWYSALGLSLSQLIDRFKFAFYNGLPLISQRTLWYRFIAKWKRLKRFC
jgi:hypothetical protein